MVNKNSIHCSNLEPEERNLHGPILGPYLQHPGMRAPSLAPIQSITIIIRSNWCHELSILFTPSRTRRWQVPCPHSPNTPLTSSSHPQRRGSRALSPPSHHQTQTSPPCSCCRLSRTDRCRSVSPRASTLSRYSGRENRSDIHISHRLHLE